MEIGKGARLKHRGEGTWTVSSAFSGSGSVKVTLVLLDESSGNLFYNKHVRRRGEDADFIRKLRNPGKNDGDYGYAISEVGLKAVTANLNKFTVISLERIDLSHMLFKMAEALHAASSKIPLKVYQNHLTEVDFVVGGSVVLVDGQKESLSSSIGIGGTKTADDGVNMTFEISHGVSV
ncbi:hypothetical protein LDO26_06540 [Luteimonas sp. BDR2-5]|uniref:hypothetical protein n=1 Tax=Proluteimonas luteida TaxID=2878685 RepID=UPI001E50659D|nr:hypothetical protein [Luteimonas sp. BDR2-5]MCD9027861.1 hypothetical protein [Luteimonas sp. BDR2-5]